MTKNGAMIHVFDASGNEIGQTYPRRVQGLIKKGRARFTDDSETAIVLTDEKNGNTEACPPMIDSEQSSQSEDRKMFENTMKMNTAAEVLEAGEAIEPAEETVIDETPETMTEELRRLYDKLDEIDREISNLNGFIRIEEERDGELTYRESERLEMMLNNWGNIREDTVHMIEAYKKERAPKENPAEHYIRDQIEVAHRQYIAMTDRLGRMLLDGEVTSEEYEERFNLTSRLTDERVGKLIKGLK